MCVRDATTKATRRTAVDTRAVRAHLQRQVLLNGVHGVVNGVRVLVPVVHRPGLDVSQGSVVTLEPRREFLRRQFPVSKHEGAQAVLAPVDQMLRTTGGTAARQQQNTATMLKQPNTASPERTSSVA